MVEHACRPSQRLNQEDLVSDISLGYIVRPYIKTNNNESRVWWHTPLIPSLGGRDWKVSMSSQWA